MIDFLKNKLQLLQKTAYWEIRYTDGRIYSELDGLDWTLLPQQGRQAVRLYCPNGEIAQLGNTVDATGKLFQFKCGILAGGVRNLGAQLVGIVTNPAGDCQCASWEYHNNRLYTFSDNVHMMRYENIGQLAFDALGIHLS